jgi:hypothetical protein
MLTAIAVRVTDGTRHFIHIYCTNLDEWREEWDRVVQLLKGTTVKVTTITYVVLCIH